MARSKKIFDIQPEDIKMQTKYVESSFLFFHLEDGDDKNFRDKSLKIVECGENCVFLVFFFAEDSYKSGQWDSVEGDEASICGSQIQFTRLTQIFGFPASLHRIIKCTYNMSGSFFFEHNPGKLFEPSKHMWGPTTFHTPEHNKASWVEVKKGGRDIYRGREIQRKRDRRGR